MPKREEKSDVIRIIGTNENIVEAAKQIKAIGDEMVCFLFFCDIRIF